MAAEQTRRPTYILGAGFSKAISAEMPVTDELGAAIRQRLDGVVDLNLKGDETFESWLTLQFTPLPFLQGFENSRRAADAARVVNEVVQVLDERVREVSAAEPPHWLRQLVAIWHAEQAVVLTFNYDTLIERAVNAVVPTTVSNGHVSYVMGDHIVFPAPPAPQPHFSGDMGAGHTEGSFELLKMHGSLTWYWATGDSTGSTLVRVRDKHLLGVEEPLAVETDFSGATALDRYIIPPITSKDHYYGSYLANTLWRMARAHLSTAVSLTTIGYSIPREDKVAGQLVGQVASDAPVAVVDLAPGGSGQPGSVLGNMQSLSVVVSDSYAGENCVADFVADKLQREIAALAKSPIFGQLEDPQPDVVVALSKGWGERSIDELYVLVLNEGTQEYEAHEVPAGYNRDKSMPIRESIFNRMPKGHRKLEHFVTAQRLAELVRDGEPFVFKDPFGRGNLVGIGAEWITVDQWDLVVLKWAPY